DPAPPLFSLEPAAPARANKRCPCWDCGLALRCFGLVSLAGARRICNNSQQFAHCNRIRLAHVPLYSVRSAPRGAAVLPAFPRAATTGGPVPGVAVRHVSPARAGPRNRHGTGTVLPRPALADRVLLSGTGTVAPTFPRVGGVCWGTSGGVQGRRRDHRHRCR